MKDKNKNEIEKDVLNRILLLLEENEKDFIENCKTRVFKRMGFNSAKEMLLMTVPYLTGTIARKTSKFLKKARKLARTK
jgi:hypothetical protein